MDKTMLLCVILGLLALGFNCVQADLVEFLTKQISFTQNEAEEFTKDIQILRSQGRTPSDRGDPGPIGARGPDGVIGQTGGPGPRGPPGVLGRHGNKGAKGHAGPPGFPGNTGQPGDKGEKGRVGLKGVKGPQGSVGSPGSPRFPAAIVSYKSQLAALKEELSKLWSTVQISLTTMMVAVVILVAIPTVLLVKHCRIRSRMKEMEANMN